MKRIIHIPLLLSLMALCLSLPAQTSNVSVLFPPATSPMDSWNVLLLNNDPADQSVFLDVQLYQGAQVLAHARTESILLKTGQNRIDLSAFPGLQNAQQLWNKPSTEQNDLKQICVEVFSPESVLPLTQACQTHMLQAPMAMYLVYPFDRDELESELPMFSWTAPAPIGKGQVLQYSMRLVEVGEFQTEKTAIQSAPAVFERSELPANHYPYTATDQRLEVDKKYAWQITAYQNGQFLARSEVWTFKLKPQAEEVESQLTQPYAELRLKLDAGYYFAKGAVRFRFDSEYGETAPVYFVYNEKQEKVQVAERTLEKKGSNLYTLHLPPGSGLQEGQFYYLIVLNHKKEKLQMRFQYFYP